MKPSSFPGVDGYGICIKKYGTVGETNVSLSIGGLTSLSYFIFYSKPMQQNESVFFFYIYTVTHTRQIVVDNNTKLVALI